jgi:hypothetical protein
MVTDGCAIVIVHREVAMYDRVVMRRICLMHMLGREHRRQEQRQCNEETTGDTNDAEHERIMDDWLPPVKFARHDSSRSPAFVALPTAEMRAPGQRLGASGIPLAERSVEVT